MYQIEVRVTDSLTGDTCIAHRLPDQKWAVRIENRDGEPLRETDEHVSLWNDDKTVFRKLIIASFTIIEAAQLAIRLAQMRERRKTNAGHSL